MSALDSNIATEALDFSDEEAQGDNGTPSPSQQSILLASQKSTSDTELAAPKRMTDEERKQLHELIARGVNRYDALITIYGKEAVEKNDQQINNLPPAKRVRTYREVVCAFKRAITAPDYPNSFLISNGLGMPRVFSTRSGALRTDESFKKRNQIGHHQLSHKSKLSYLDELGIGMVTQFPLTWANAKVIFIPKQGRLNHATVKDCRPIRLISLLLKTLERLVDAHMKNTVNVPFLCEFQHAFIVGRYLIDNGVGGEVLIAYPGCRHVRSSHVFFLYSSLFICLCRSYSNCNGPDQFNK